MKQFYLKSIIESEPDVSYVRTVMTEITEEKMEGTVDNEEAPDWFF